MSLKKIIPPDQECCWHVDAKSCTTDDTSGCFGGYPDGDAR